MAEMNSAIEGRSKSKKGAKRSKKLNTRIDLTPMVDLGFFLIAFFMTNKLRSKILGNTERILC